MSHGRKPRRARWPAQINTLGRAYTRAARMTAAEVGQIMATIKPGAAHILAGSGTRDHWTAVAGACTLAQAIEAQGIVRGLAEHLQAAEAALNAISARAEQPCGTWRPQPLRFDERAAVALLVDLVAFQLTQLSAGELAAATDRAAARVRQAGGLVIRLDIEAPAGAQAQPPFV